jgi:hypothetical protein
MNDGDAGGVLDLTKPVEDVVDRLRTELSVQASQIKILEKEVEDAKREAKRLKDALTKERREHAETNVGFIAAKARVAELLEPSPDLTPKAWLRRFKDFETIYLAVYADLTELVDRVRKNRYNEEQLVDIGFICRQIEGWTDELRKEAKAKTELVGKVLALSLARKALQGGEQTVVHGTLARGSTSIRTIPVLPKAGTPEYTELCAHFGVPEELEKAGVIGFSFSKLADLCAAQAADGKNPPPGIRRTYTQMGMIFTKITEG